MIEHERACRQSGHIDDILQIVVQEILDALVDRAEVGRKKAILLVAQGQHALDETGQVAIVSQREGRASEIPQLEIDVEEEPLLVLVR